MRFASLRQEIQPLMELAWPLALSRSTQVLFGISDALLVGHLGETALAATTDGALLAFVLIVLPLGLVSIVSAFAAQLHGAGNPSGAQRHACYGIVVAVATEAVILGILPALPWVLSHLQQSAELQALLTAYLRVRLLSTGAAVGLEALTAYYCGVGNTRLPTIVAIAALGLNVAGNWLLIDGRCGLPALGVMGSALASTLATTCAFAVLLTVFAGTRRERAGVVAALSGRELLRMLRFGWPIGVNLFFEFFAFTIFVNVFMAGFGTTILAATMIVLQVCSITSTPSFGLASAGAVLVGQAIGAGQRDAVPRLVRVTLSAAIAWQVLMGLLYCLLGRHLLSPFVADGPHARTLIDSGALMLVLSAVWTGLDVVAATYSEALSAAGDTAITLRARVALFTAVFVPGAWLLIHQLGGAWVGLVAWYATCSALIAAVLHVRFRRGAWRNIQLTDNVAWQLSETAVA